MRGETQITDLRVGAPALALAAGLCTLSPFSLTFSYVQSNTLRPYLTCIRSTLEAALCLRNFPSQLVRVLCFLEKRMRTNIVHRV